MVIQIILVLARKKIITAYCRCIGQQNTKVVKHNEKGRKTQIQSYCCVEAKHLFAKS